LKKRNRFHALELTAQDILSGAYKQHLGGGAEEWERRGLAQLDFLRSVGLTPESTLLDIGCGPLRAGVPFIRYLAAGNYAGFDFNASIVNAARFIVNVNADLAAKRPTLLRIDDFAVAGMGRRFDLALAFSVLNHCNEHQRFSFFYNIAAGLARHARLYVTHAAWFGPQYLAAGRLALARTLTAADLADSFLIREVCPILELVPAV
jgi:SAM-dependent methyltransferase